MDVATDISDNEFEKYWEAIFDRCVAVLKQLKQKGLFKDVSTNFILLFEVSDYSDEEKQIKWVEKLNSAELADEFKQVLSGDE